MTDIDSIIAGLSAAQPIRTKRMEPWSKDAGITVSKREWEQMRADLDWWADVADALDCVVSGWTFRRDATFVHRSGRAHDVQGWFAAAVRSALIERAAK